MHCVNCGAEIQGGNKFCANCGKPVGEAACEACGTPLKPGVNFCPGCGKSVAAPAQTASAPPPRAQSAPYAAPQAGIATDLRDLAPGEVVLMDTGTFPISYIKNLMTSINGKLYLTSHRIVFKAGALQGVGGVAVGGLFIPNPADANKSRKYFAIPLNQVTSVESGWANITVQAGEKYKFGGMQKTKEWAAAINRAIGRG
jgi:hypothetical protein